MYQSNQSAAAVESSFTVLYILIYSKYGYFTHKENALINVFLLA